MTLRVDLHIHTDHSIDGRHSLERMAAAAKQAGLDAMAITDHDQCTPLPPELEGVLLIPACEISTQVGHITGLFLDRPVAFDTLCKDGRPTGQAAVEEIHRCGGLAVAAHPFQKPGVDGSRLPPGLDAVEGVNARANFKVSDANAKARQWAMDHHLPAVGGSDSHGFQEVGNGYTEVDCPEKALSALKEAITAGPVPSGPAPSHHPSGKRAFPAGQGTEAGRRAPHRQGSGLCGFLPVPRSFTRSKEE